MTAPDTQSTNTKRKRVNHPHVLVFPLLLLTFALTSARSWATEPNTETSPPCKYSVRDVAFVNVHGDPWQLQLIKSRKITPETFTDLNSMITSKLEHSNVKHIWLAEGSPEAVGLQHAVEVGQSAPATSAIVDSEGRMSRFPFGSFAEKSIEQFSDDLDRLLESKARDQILAQLVDSLCVIVLFESDNEQLNATAHEALDSSIEQLNRQMWMLEKATDKGPAIVTISHKQPHEEWLFFSLGVDPSQKPAVAILYGQGRRLGEVLTGDEIEASKIVSRASICGQNCECSLNRDWLYGQQIMHVWDKELERKTESSLTFDPNSAFVIAEVAQIIRKNSMTDQANSRVELGSGLIIHDLDELESSSEDQTTKSSEQLSDIETGGEVAELETGNVQPTPTETTDQKINLPFSLIALLGVGVLVIAAWLFFKAPSI